MIRLYCNRKELKFNRVEWSGTDLQSSRTLTFNLLSNPYDVDFNQPVLKLGDIISLYDDDTQLFVGTLTSREQTAEIGTLNYVAKDFMHHLLRSYASYKFDGYNPERIARKVCSDAGILIGDLAQTKASLPKLFFDSASLYDIIVRAYQGALGITKKLYMLVMDGKRLSVVEKGKASGVTLSQGVDIISATYNETTDNMVNLVKIYNEELDEVGSVKNELNIEKYGVYQQTMTEQEDADVRNNAEKQLVGITREANVSAIGDLRALSGRSIKILDVASGLAGLFYITGDQHVFENGIHTMNLNLGWNNEAEQGAEALQDKDEGRAEITQTAIAYFVENTNLYHSYKGCPICKGKQTIKTDVATIKTVRNEQGKLKYKPCSTCWITT